MSNIISILDAKACRAAKRLGLRAIKSQSRTGSEDDRGEFMLTTLSTIPLARKEFDLRAEDVIAICQNFARRKRG